MKRKELINYYKTLHQTFEEQLEELPFKFDRKGTKKFRKNIKKIDAFIHFLNYVKPAFDRRKNFKPFKKLSKTAQNILKSQDTISLASVFERQFNLRFQFQKMTPAVEEVYNRTQFRRVLNDLGEHAFDKSRRRVIRSLKQTSDDAIYREAKNYLFEAINMIVQLTRRRGNIEERLMFQIRKILKLFFLNLKMFLAFELVEPLPNQLMRDLTELSQNLEDWYDGSIALFNMQGFNITAITNGLSYPEMKQAVIHYEIGQEERFKQVRYLIDAFPEKAELLI